MERSPIHVIRAANGMALGVGAEIVLCTDQAGMPLRYLDPTLAAFVFHLADSFFNYN